MITRLKSISNDALDYDYAGCFDEKYAISFVTNQDVKIRGISLHSIHIWGGTHTLTGTIQLLDSAEKIVYSQVFSYNTDSTPQYVDQFFADPPQITANEEYIITLTYDSCYLIWYSENPENPVDSTCSGKSVRFTFNHHELSSFSILTQGQIPRIFFAC